MVIKALQYEVLEIGKRIKRSKKSFAWRFLIDSKEHTVIAVASYISGKRKIISNGKPIFEGKKSITSGFQFPFSIGNNMIIVEQCNDGFELRINNVAFSDIHNPFEHKSTYESYPKNSGSSYAKPSGIAESEKSGSHTQKEYKTSKHVSGRWGDVQKAAHIARKAPTKESPQIQDFEPKKSESETKSTLAFAKKSSETSSPQKIDSHQNKENAGDFKNFTNFDIPDYAKKPRVKTEFEDFSKFDQINIEKPAQKEAEAKPFSNMMDLLNMDASNDESEETGQVKQQNDFMTINFSINPSVTKIKNNDRPNEREAAKNDPLSNAMSKVKNLIEYNSKLKMWDNELDNININSNYQQKQYLAYSQNNFQQNQNTYGNNNFNNNHQNYNFNTGSNNYQQSQPWQGTIYQQKATPFD